MEGQPQRDVDQICHFLRETRSVDEKVLRKIREEKMDGTAVLFASTENLKELGLVLGDILSLKSFCDTKTHKHDGKEEREQRKQQLFQKLFGEKKKSSTLGAHSSKTSPCDQSTVSSKLNRAIKVFLGWQHFDETEKRYKQVRLVKGGGVREVHLSVSSTYEDIIDLAIDMFFKGGMNTTGSAADMEFGLGNFQSQIINEKSGFTLQMYRDAYNLPRVKIYLLSKRKCRTMKEDPCTSFEDDADDEILLKPAFSVKDTPQHEVKKRRLDTTEASTLIDLTEDSASNEVPLNEESNAAPSFARVVDVSGKMPANCPHQLMENDGSDSDELHKESEKKLEEHHPGDHFRRQILPQILKSREGVKEHTIDMDERRLEVLNFLRSTGTCEATVRREAIFDDVMKLYCDETILTRDISFSVEGEIGVDLQGLKRDVFTSFWEQASFHFLESCGGNFIPRSSGLTRDQYIALGRVLSHGYIVAGVFPVFLNQAYMQALLFGEASLTDEATVQSLIDFLPVYERERLLRILCGTELDPLDCEFLLDLEDRGGVTLMPTAESCNAIVQLVSRSILIETPMHTMAKIREGMMQIPHSQQLWESITTEEFLNLYNELKPTPGKVASLLHSTCETSDENRIFDFLQRYVRSLSQEDCVKFVRWVTGSDCLIVARIDVQFHQSEEKEPFPRAHTCSGMIDISSTGYHTFIAFRKVMDSILKNDEVFKFTNV